MNDTNNERFEVLLDEIALQICALKQKYSNVLEKIIRISKLRGFDVSLMAGYIKESTSLYCQNILKLVEDQMGLVTDDVKKSLYAAQLNGLRDDLMQALDVTHRMATMKSEGKAHNLLVGRKQQGG